MTTLTDLRKQLAAILVAAEINALPEVPERTVPPVVLLEPGEPWLEPGAVFGGRTGRLDLFVIAGPGTNAAALAALEQLLSQVLAVDLDPWWITTVSTPYIATVNGYEYLTARATAIAADLTITTT